MAKARLNGDKVVLELNMAIECDAIAMHGDDEDAVRWFVENILAS